MPKDTFFRLPEEKRKRIMVAAENEFLENSFDAASINRIIKEAAIPRGSFYQYFEDKKDLFTYTISIHKDEVFDYIEGVIQECEGDIFLFMRRITDFIMSGTCGDRWEAFIRIFSEPIVFEMLMSNTIKEKMENACNQREIVFKYIDKNKLNVESDKEIVTLINIFFTITMSIFFRTLIVGRNNHFEREKIKEDIYAQIEVLEKKFRK